MVANGVKCSVDHSQNEDLLKPIQEEEVKQALFQMYPDKAPGPDGMGPGPVGISLVVSTTLARKLTHLSHKNSLALSVKSIGIRDP
uniref:Uncharacterized protein n=1 Tax=Cannabis sativa TaxID=3483 RepID=A0A803Q578_CANSA